MRAGSYSWPSLAAALRKVGPVPHLGSAIELVPLAWVRMSGPEGMSVGELALPLVSCSTELAELGAHPSGLGIGQLGGRRTTQAEIQGHSNIYLISELLGFPADPS